MAGNWLPARFSLHSQLWFRWTGKCFETATSHMQTVAANIKMKRLLIILLPYLLTSCFSENEKSETTEIVSNDSIQTVSETLQKINNRECMRGKPEPALDSTNFHDYMFELIDKTTAIEIAEKENGDKITIRHGGCEYFVLTYRIETSRFKADTTDIGFWYKKTVKLLSEIEDANKSPIDIKTGISALVNYIDNYSEKKLRNEIDYADSEIRQYVTIDRIEQIDKTQFAIEITFVIGPL